MAQQKLSEVTQYAQCQLYDTFEKKQRDRCKKYKKNKPHIRV